MFKRQSIKTIALLTKIPIKINNPIPLIVSKGVPVNNNIQYAPTKEKGMAIITESGSTKDSNKIPIKRKTKMIDKYTPKFWLSLLSRIRAYLLPLDQEYP